MIIYIYKFQIKIEMIYFWNFLFFLILLIFILLIFIIKTNFINKTIILYNAIIKKFFSKKCKTNFFYKNM